MSLTSARESYGQPKRGQLWKYKKTGKITELLKKVEGDSWRVCIHGSGIKGSHKLRINALYAHFDLVS